MNIFTRENLAIIMFLLAMVLIAMGLFGKGKNNLNLLFGSGFYVFFIMLA